MSIPEDVKKKRAILHDTLVDVDAVLLEIVFNKLHVGVFEDCLWEYICNLIFYHDDFEYINFCIISDTPNSIKMIEIIESCFNEEEEKHKSLDYFERKKFVNSWKEKVRFTLLPTLDDKSNDNWSFLSVTKYTKDGTRETREIEK